SVEQVTAQVQALGIDRDSKVVIYDARGAFSGPRAWWLLKSHGLTDVYLLNGGLNAWQAMGYPLVENKLDEADKPGDFKAQYQADCFVDKDEVHAWVLQNDLDQADNSYLIDVRSAERFAGLSPEPREGLRAGHIPHSLNLPFTQLLHPEDRSYLSHAALKDQFEAVLDISIDECIQKNTRLMFTCGSGMTACIALLAAWQLGLRNLAVYDGSWTEWGSDASLPIA
ncbi:MAG: sulfurtransferase, partial [Vibrio sp.]